MDPKIKAVPVRPELLPHPAIARAVEYIHTNHGPDMKLADAADRALLSSSHFSRLFHEVVGVTFQQYLTVVRVQRARQLILDRPYDQISSIAYRVGFRSVRTFQVGFKKLEGQTPSAFRAHARRSERRNQSSV